MKEKAKQLPQKIRRRGGNRDREYEEDYVEYDQYDRRGSGRSGRDRGNDYDDDAYQRRRSGRAKSVGQDDNGGRGLRDNDRRRRMSRAQSRL